ncbi:MAG: hypothetical protein EOO65_01635 [Methanosarcinales archaeon]|nr:MAG: hypothetical protein EOO65_01635 [Methanosarcinales archaeon]
MLPAAPRAAHRAMQPPCLHITATSAMDFMSSNPFGAIRSAPTSPGTVPPVLFGTTANPFSDGTVGGAGAAAFPTADASDELPASFLSTATKNDKLGELQKLFDQLSTLLVSCPNIELPQVVAIGDQSAGKSSVLERISGIKLPRGTGTVTRCPIRVQMHTDKSARITLRIPDVPGMTSASSLTLDRDADVSMEQLVAELSAHMKRLADGPKFSELPLVVNVYGPDLPSFTIVDLPGLVADTEEKVCIENMYRAMCSNSRAVMLVVAPATSDLATQGGFVFAKRMDPEQKRTLGVITKADMVIHVDKTRAETEAMVLGADQQFKLALGWVLIRNADADELAAGKPRKAIADKEEDVLRKAFSMVPEKMRGLRALEARLTEQAIKQNALALEPVHMEVLKELARVSSALAKLPEPVNPTDAVMRFARLLHQAQAEAAQLRLQPLSSARPDPLVMAALQADLTEQEATSWPALRTLTDPDARYNLQAALMDDARRLLRDDVKKEMHKLVWGAETWRAIRKCVSHTNSYGLVGEYQGSGACAEVLKKVANLLWPHVQDVVHAAFQRLHFMLHRLLSTKFAAYEVAMQRVVHSQLTHVLKKMHADAESTLKNTMATLAHNLIVLDETDFDEMMRTARHYISDEYDGEWPAGPWTSSRVEAMMRYTGPTRKESEEDSCDDEAARHTGATGRMEVGAESDEEVEADFEDDATPHAGAALDASYIASSNELRLKIHAYATLMRREMHCATLLNVGFYLCPRKLDSVMEPLSKMDDIPGMFALPDDITQLRQQLEEQQRSLAAAQRELTEVAKRLSQPLSCPSVRAAHLVADSLW